MALLDPVQLSEAEVEAIRLAVAGPRQDWLGIVVTRSTPAEIPSAGPSGVESDQSPAIPIDQPAAAQTDKDRIKMERRRAVDAYVAECRKAGIKTTRVDIWKKAGYRSRIEFERWQRNDARATDTADRTSLGF
jgi:hypothetical protein